MSDIEKYKATMLKTAFDADWMFLALRKKKTQTIKLIRTNWNLGLKDAKDFVDAWQEWVFETYPQWEWMIWAIGRKGKGFEVDMDVAVELCYKIQKMTDKRQARKMVKQFAKDWAVSGGKGWDVGIGELDGLTSQPEPKQPRFGGGTIQDLRSHFQKG